MKKDKLLIISLIFFTTTPFLYLLTNIDFSLSQVSSELFLSNLALVVGNVAGYIGAVLLMWEFIYGIRQVISLFSKDLNWVMKVHQWIGKYGMFFVFLHPILMLYAYAENVNWIFLPSLSTSSETQITYGRIGLVLFLLIYITSALVRGKIKYRPWLYIHYLSYPILALVFIHALDLGTFLEKFLILKMVWFGMITMFGFMCVYRFASYASLTSNKLKLLKKERITNDIYYLTFEIEGKFPNITAGQYMYLQLKRFGESHPFTILEYDEDRKTLKFGIKALGSFTKKFIDLKKDIIMYADGPYGVFTLEGQNENPKVILSGGIGITPFVELVKRFGNESTFFINCNKDLYNALYRNELKKINNIKYFDVFSQTESKADPYTYNGRVDNNIIRSIVGDNLSKANFFICGSKRYTEGMKKILHECGVLKDKIFSEDFY